MTNCPHCGEATVDIHTINCSNCSGRVRCPECGSLLKYDDAHVGYAVCSACDFRMPSAKRDEVHETAQAMAKVAGAYGVEVSVPQLPTEPILEWDKDRWEAADRLLFPREKDRAVLVFIVTDDDITCYSATHPDFKHTLKVHLDSTSKYLKEDFFGR